MSQKFLRWKLVKLIGQRFQAWVLKNTRLKQKIFQNIWVRFVEIEGIELDVPFINEIELEREGEVEIKFVPIRPGEYEFEIEGLQSKGMVGKFVVK